MSLNWKEIDGQEEWERWFWGMFDIESLSDQPQPEELIEMVHQRWISWAHKHGDMTYLKHTDGVRLYPDYRKYGRDL